MRKMSIRKPVDQSVVGGLYCSPHLSVSLRLSVSGILYGLSPIIISLCTTDIIYENELLLISRILNNPRPTIRRNQKKLKFKLLGSPSLQSTTEAYKIYTILSCEANRVPPERS